MKYEDFPTRQWHVIRNDVDSQETTRVTAALVSAAMYEPDFSRAKKLVLGKLDDSDPWIRRVAVICVGHYARAHGAERARPFLPRLIELLNDEECRGNVLDVFEDLLGLGLKDTKLQSIVEEDEQSPEDNYF